MPKRKSSVRDSDEELSLNEYPRKSIALEETLKDDDSDDHCSDDNDGDDDDVEDDEDDDDDEEDEDESNMRNVRGNKNFNNFISQGESETEKKETSVKKGSSKNFAYNYMVRLGYKDGTGLGRLGNGIVEPVEASKQRGTRGLGYYSNELQTAIERYDPKEEDEILEEKIDWLINDHPTTLHAECLQSWVTYGPSKIKLTEDSAFCESHIIRGIIESKNILDSFNEKVKQNGRRRSNPFESIQNAIFLNRAAMKMANMDAVLDKMFTEPKTKRGENVVGPNELLYFADVCAGPGGFSEYVLYRKKWWAKGFGFTLRSENDFKLEQFIAGPSETFDPHYGAKEDGDIFEPENIISFRDHVMKYTDNIGVHFMMADGGVHIDKNFCEQEIICKKLYICQCIVALYIVRTGGHFVVKLFDLFTEFSVGLVYLMYRSFEEILIIKPETSRPANSERYLVCKWKRKDCHDIANHLFEVNKKIPRDFQSQKQDVLELVPTDVLENDEKFFKYIKSSNERIGEKQIKNLMKMAAFSENTELVDLRQQRLRKECLEKWNIPDEARAEPKKCEPRSKWNELIGNSSFCEMDYCNKKNKITSIQSFKRSVGNAKYSWNAIVLSQEESNTTCGFYLGLGKSNVHRYSAGKWTKLNSIALCLPASTIVYGEIVPEFLGSERSQRKIQAFHIIDGLFLGGEDIRHHSFQKRGELCALFAKALFKETCPIRVKERYHLGKIKDLWDRLVLKKTKSCAYPCLGILLDEHRFYKAVGIMFIKDMKGSWNRYISKTYNQFFVDNMKEKIYETDVMNTDASKSVYANFDECFGSRLIWWWDEGVVVHKSQRFHQDRNKMQRDELDDFLNDIER